MASSRDRSVSRTRESIDSDQPPPDIGSARLPKEEDASVATGSAKPSPPRLANNMSASSNNMTSTSAAVPASGSPSAATGPSTADVPHAASSSTRRDLAVPQGQSIRSSASGRGQQLSSAGPSSGVQSVSVSRSPSAAATPRSSRDSSPAGAAFRQTSTNATSTTNASRGMRSRKNSHDVSPQRPSSITSTVPSAAAIQRALSSAAAPQLQPTSSVDPGSRPSRAQRPNGSAELSRDGPSWPTSPRLKSPPPPDGPRRSSLRNQHRPDDSVAGPSVVNQKSTPDFSIENPIQKETENLAHKSLGSGRAASGAPTLETVPESSSNVTTPEPISLSRQRYVSMHIYIHVNVGLAPSHLPR
jgi:hypothetical protein